MLKCILSGKPYALLNCFEDQVVGKWRKTEPGERYSG